MRLGHLAVWCAAVAIATPLAAQETVNWDCGSYYCGSAASWDAGSNTISGDSFTWDWYDDGNEVSVNAVMDSPDGHWLDSGGLELFETEPIVPECDTEDADAEVEYSLFDPGPGTWDTDGDHQYAVWNDDAEEWVWTDMGGDLAYDNATNSDVPTSETTSQYAPAPHGYGETFKIALVADSPWNGLLDEQLDSNDPPFPFWAVTDNLLMACDAFISCGFQRDEDTSEVNTQWVRNKISHSSSRSTLR